MTSNDKLIDQAALIRYELKHLGEKGGPDAHAMQIVALAAAIEGIALYIAERDGIKLTQP